MHYVMQDSKTFHEIPHDVVAGTVFACPDMISECAEVNKNKQSRFDVLSDKIIVLKPINSWAGTFFYYDERIWTILLSSTGKRSNRGCIIQ